MKGLFEEVFKFFKNNIKNMKDPAIIKQIFENEKKAYEKEGSPKPEIVTRQ